MQLLDRRFVAAVRARSADETLCSDADETGRDSERLDADVGKTGDRANGVVGVQRRQHQVTSHRRLESDRRRFLVANFSDEQHVGVLTQHGPQYSGEG